MIYFIQTKSIQLNVLERRKKKNDNASFLFLHDYQSKCPICLDRIQKKSKKKFIFVKK